MPVEQWFKMVIYLRSGVTLTLHNSCDYCKENAEKIWSLQAFMRSKTIECVVLDGWIATPLIVTVKHCVDPTEVAAISIVYDPQFTYSLNLEDHDG